MKKSLLRAWTLLCTLLVGIAAQAGVETKTIDFEDGQATFTGRSRCEVSVIDDADLGSKVLYMKCASNAQNGYSLANLNLVDLFKTIDRAAKVNVKMKYWSANGSRAILFLRDATLAGELGDKTGVAKNKYGNDFAWFRFGSDKSNGFVQNTASSGNLSKCTDQWLNLDITVDVEANTVDYTVTTLAGEELFAATADQPYSAQAKASVPAKCSQIELWGFINNSSAFKIDDVQITVTASDAQFAAFTVKYVDAEGNEIAAARAAEGEVGKAAQLLATDKSPIYTTEPTAKYVYDSDNSAETTVTADGSAVVTVKFTKAPVYTFTVEEDGGQVLYKGSGFAGDVVNYYIPYYFLDDDNNLYCKPSSPQYGQGTVTLDANKKVVGLTYTLDAANNAVFYAEAEDIATLTAYDDQYTQIRMSNGKAAYAAQDGAVVATLLTPGKYTLTSATRAGSANFSVNGKEVLAISSTGSVVTTTSTEFSVFGKTDITVSQGDVKNYFDYVLIRKTGDVTEEERQAANLAAAQADMEKLEALQTKLTQATLGNEEFITEAENKQIKSIMDDTYTMKISDAYAAVAESGAYASPINWAELEAQVDGIISNINARKEGLLPLYTEKGVVGDGTEMSAKLPFYNTPVTVDVYGIDQYANEKVVVKAWDGVEGSDLHIRFAKMGFEEEMVIITDLVQTVNGDTVSTYKDDEENPERSMYTLQPQGDKYSVVGIFPNSEMSTVLIGTDEEEGMGQLSLYGIFYPKAAASDDDDPDASMGVAEAVEAAYIVTWPGEPQPAMPLYTADGVVGDGTEMSATLPFYNTPVAVSVYEADQYANEKVVVKAWDGVEGSDLHIRFAKMGWGEEMVIITDLVQTVNGDTVSYYEDNEENPELSMFNLKPQAGKYAAVGVLPNSDMTTVLVGTGDEEGMGMLSLYGLFYPKAAASDDDPDAGMGVVEPIASVYMVTWPGTPLPEPIKEARTWDFANGGAHESQIVGNTDYWSESSKGRYALAVDLVNQELPGIGGKALTGMEGIYLTVGKGAVYGITQNFCFQNNDIAFRIPDCAAGDTITVEYCSASKNTEVTLTSDDLAEGSSTTSTSKVSFSSTVVAAGDVTIALANSKGSRLYTVSVAPFDGEDPVAISDVTAKANVATGAVYNLAGQKVADGFKGIVIKNGKKVSVK